MIADIVTYGISFSVGKLKGNIFYNGMLLGVSDFMSTLSVSCLSNFSGWKIAWFITWGFGTVGCILYDIAPTDTNIYVQYALLVVGWIGAAGSFAMCFLMTSESFPTAYRGTVFAVCNAMARLGGIISPEISVFTDRFMLIFGLMCGLAFSMTIFVRETKGLALKDEVN